MFSCPFILAYRSVLCSLRPQACASRRGRKTHRDPRTSGASPASCSVSILSQSSSMLPSWHSKQPGLSARACAQAFFCAGGRKMGAQLSRTRTARRALQAHERTLYMVFECTRYRLVSRLLPAMSSLGRGSPTRCRAMGASTPRSNTQFRAALNSGRRKIEQVSYLTLSTCVRSREAERARAPHSVETKKKQAQSRAAASLAGF